MSLMEPQSQTHGLGKHPDTEDVHERSSSSHDGDVETGSEPDVAEIERIYKKLDYRIIPAFWVLYFLCAAVRSNVSLAQTMNTDAGHDLGSVLHCTPHQISTGLALFYVCYVVFDLPSNLIMTRLSPHVWMSRIVISVGVIGTCMTAMKAAWSLYLLRLLLGIVIAGMWPGMTYYLTLFYPPSRTGKRIGQYYTAAQVSAAVVGLVSAGFQEMDGERGYVGFQWMFLVYGVITIAVGIILLWWLPDRPLAPGAEPPRRKYLWWFPRSPPALTGRDAEIHYHDLKRVYHRAQWTWKDLLYVFLDWRLWPLLIMYFGVVGVGIGVQSYATVIIEAINPSLSSIDLSLLSAPIWIMDLIAIVLITPFSDRFHHHRALFFSIPVCLQILGLLLTTYAGTDTNSWPRYGGLLIVGFGLGPTVPITMTWTAEVFQQRHGEVGVAAASAVVSGWGNLGSILTTYALYSGWTSDYEAPGRAKYRKSNLVMVGILCASILAAVLMEVLLRVVDGRKRKRGGEAGGDGGEEDPDKIVDGAARREARQRGLDGLGPGMFKFWKKSR
ncbi:MFS general substrate transporter [Aspergillus sclerotiicarbonarius CBS 121057]|uniref:MFS general substrate transporter n=1 Tax=Aspergillus sclerotiicarbonarius (strain CBS 121057 / IBT 28362) TaxID=1448318 RepID=A0A319EWA6_ASPSB|nr:MFS general substrate transporter [Aspergillus sclerotiicarbonarius CBS 121057]